MRIERGRSENAKNGVLDAYLPAAGEKIWGSRFEGGILGWEGKTGPPKAAEEKEQCSDLQFQK